MHYKMIPILTNNLIGVLCYKDNTQSLGSRVWINHIWGSNKIKRKEKKTGATMNSRLENHLYIISDYVFCSESSCFKKVGKLIISRRFLKTF